MGCANILVSMIVCFLAPAASMAAEEVVPDVGSEGQAACEMTIEFVAPADWLCSRVKADPCTVCRNVSDHSSELVTRCVDGATKQQRRIPPGAELSICHDHKGLVSPL